MRGFSTIALLAASSLAAGADSSSAASSAAASASSPAAAATPSCAQGLYMVVARGSEEPVGPGSAANITNQVQQAIAGSVVAAVDYPATLEQYQESESEGVAAMHELLQAYQKACPTSKTAIIGYSQGAQVGMDTVCGGIGGDFTSAAAVSSSILDNVVAIVVFGDPSHVLNVPYDIGTADQHGLFPRNDTAGCVPAESKIQSYCDKGDVYCSGGSDLVVHHEYIDKYGSDMVKFIVDKYHAALNATSGSSSGTAKPSSSGTAKPSGAGASSVPKATGSPNAAGPALAPPAGALFGAAVVAVVTSALFSLAQL